MGTFCKTSLYSLDAVQKRLRSLVGEELFKTLQPLSHRRNVASLSLFYRYFHGRCSDELHQMVPPLKKFGRRTRLANTSHQYVLDIPKAKSNFHSQSFFPRTAGIWNRLPQSCFPDTYDLGLFKSRVHKFFLHYSLTFIFSTIYMCCVFFLFDIFVVNEIIKFLKLFLHSFCFIL